MESPRGRPLHAPPDEEPLQAGSATSTTTRPAALTMVGLLLASLLVVLPQPTAGAIEDEPADACPEGTIRVYMTASGVFDGTGDYADANDAVNDMAVQASLAADDTDLCITIGVPYNRLASVAAEVTTEHYDVIYLQGQNNWWGTPAGEFDAADAAVLTAFINAGGGLVVGEWHAWNVCAYTGDAWDVLDDLLPITIRDAPFGCAYGSDKDVRFFRATDDGPVRPLTDAIDSGVADQFIFEPADFAGSLSFVDAKPGATVFFYATWAVKDPGVPAEDRVPAATAPSQLVKDQRSSEPGGGVGMAGWAPVVEGDINGRVFAFSTTNGAPELEDISAANSFRRLLINALGWAGDTSGTLNPDVLQLSTAADSTDVMAPLATNRIGDVVEFSFELVGGDPLPASITFDTTTGTFSGFQGTEITAELLVTGTEVLVDPATAGLTFQGANGPRSGTARVLMAPGEVAAGFVVEGGDQPAPEPQPEPDPGPAPSPPSLPDPDPAPEPDPEPDPESAPEADPDPAPESDPEPVPEPDSSPDTDPTPDAGVVLDEPVAVDGQLPSLPHGETLLLVDGVEQAVVVTLNQDATALTLTGAGIELELSVTTPDGTPRQLDTNGRIVLDRNELVAVAGEGFAPNSDAAVWLFSTPSLLGTLTLDTAGSFDATLPLPETIEPGPHTLQVNGVAPDGQIRSLSLGVVVLADATPVGLPDTGSDTGLLILAGLLLLATGAIALRRRTTTPTG